MHINRKIIFIFSAFYKENMISHSYSTITFFLIISVLLKIYERKVANTCVYFQSAININFSPNDHRKQTNR